MGKQLLLLVAIALVLSFGGSETTEDPVTDNTSPEYGTDPPAAQPPTVDPEDEEAPEGGSWNIQGDDGTYCILSMLAMRMKFTYTVNGQESIVIYDLPANNTDSDSSTCNAGDNEQRLEVHFFENDWMLAVNFKKYIDWDTGNRDWFVSGLNLTYVYGEPYFPGVEGTKRQTVKVESEDLFMSDIWESFQCVEKKVNDFEKPESDAPQLHVDTWNLRFQPFRTRTDQKFAFAARCPEDLYIPMTIPTAIGGVLAAIICSCLTIYFIIRMRRGNDYDSSASANS